MITLHPRSKLSALEQFALDGLLSHWLVFGVRHERLPGGALALSGWHCDREVVFYVFIVPPGAERPNVGAHMARDYRRTWLDLAARGTAVAEAKCMAQYAVLTTVLYATPDGLIMDGAA